MNIFSPANALIKAGFSIESANTIKNQLKFEYDGIVGIGKSHTEAAQFIVDRVYEIILENDIKSFIGG